MTEFNQPLGEGGSRTAARDVGIAEGAVSAASEGELRIVLPFGGLAFIGACGSLLSCYLVILMTSLLGLERAALAEYVNPHVQAVVMWGMALLAVYALWRDRAHHESIVPFALAATATVVLIATLYVSYDSRIELLVYVLLVISALLNQNAFLGALNRKVVGQAREIEALNRSLEYRVESQNQEMDRLGRIRRLVAPQIADLIVSQGDDRILDSHRRYIACLFCDLRNFTAISEAVEPEEVMSILRAYHERVDGLVSRHGGTIGFRSGDGVMAFFNDPVPCDRPVLEAVKAALEIRDTFDDVRDPWARLGHTIGLGMGIASGYATMGLVGQEGRADYTAIGGAVNLASRLCDRAEDGRILVGPRAYVDVEADVDARDLGSFELKGVASPVKVYEIIGLSGAAA